MTICSYFYGPTLWRTFRFVFLPVFTFTTSWLPCATEFFFFVRKRKFKSFLFVVTIDHRLTHTLLLFPSTSTNSGSEEIRCDGTGQRDDVNKRDLFEGVKEEVTKNPYVGVPFSVPYLWGQFTLHYIDPTFPSRVRLYRRTKDEDWCLQVGPILREVSSRQTFVKRVDRKTFTVVKTVNEARTDSESSSKP